MKTIKTTILGLVLSSIFLFMSCNKDNGNQEELFETVPYNTIEEFFEANEVENQEFTLDATLGGTITGTKGTQVEFTANSLVDTNGDVVTGDVKVKLREIFDISDMVSSNKPTNAITPTGENTFLISAGETEVTISQNGSPVEIRPDRSMTIVVPENATPDEGMQAFIGNLNGVQDVAGNMVGAGTMTWTLAPRPAVTIQQDTASINSTPFSYMYQVFSTGWRNCDRFYAYQGDKTTTKIDLRTSPNQSQTAMFMVFKEDNRPAVVRYTSQYSNGLKSYTNSMPVGLQVTFVAISIEDSRAYLATKQHTISENEELVLEFAPVTEEELKDALEALN